jgi:hypothetical protein
MPPLVLTPDGRSYRVTGGFNFLDSCIVDAISSSPLVSTKLDQAQRRLASAARESRPRILPHPRLIQRCVDELLAFLEVDTEKARAALARHMPPLILTPDRGAYRITGGFNLSLFVAEEPSSAAAPAVAAAERGSWRGAGGYQNRSISAAR